jgi:hypothetical protein
VCVKFCEKGRPWNWSCSLTQSDFLVLAQVVHVDVISNDFKELAEQTTPSGIRYLAIRLKDNEFVTWR